MDGDQTNRRHSRSSELPANRPDNVRKVVVNDQFDLFFCVQKKNWRYERIMEKRFKLKEHNTTVKREIVAGLTTFMAMAYILMVNANMFANPFSDGTNVLGVSYGAIYIATAISAVIGTVLIGLQMCIRDRISGMPLASAVII